MPYRSFGHLPRTVEHPRKFLLRGGFKTVLIPFVVPENSFAFGRILTQAFQGFSQEACGGLGDYSKTSHPPDSAILAIDKAIRTTATAGYHICIEDLFAPSTLHSASSNDFLLIVAPDLKCCARPRAPKRSEGGAQSACRSPSRAWNGTTTGSQRPPPSETPSRSRDASTTKSVPNPRAPTAADLPSSNKLPRPAKQFSSNQIVL